MPITYHRSVCCCVAAPPAANGCNGGSSFDADLVLSLAGLGAGLGILIVSRRRNTFSAGAYPGPEAVTGWGLYKTEQAAGSGFDVMRLSVLTGTVPAASVTVPCVAGEEVMVHCLSITPATAGIASFDATLQFTSTCNFPTPAGGGLAVATVCKWYGGSFGSSNLPSIFCSVGNPGGSPSGSATMRQHVSTVAAVPAWTQNVSAGLATWTGVLLIA